MKKVIIIIIIVFLLFCTNVFNNSAFSIKMNWNFYIKTENELIYTKNNRSGFPSDGYVYTILLYDDINDILKKNNWESSKNLEIEKYFSEILSKINVDKQFIPNFENRYIYYTETDRDNSMLYVIYFENTDILYVLEQFL